MPRSITRRQWMIQSGIAAAGLVLARGRARPYGDALELFPPGEGEILARLNSNENPYGPSEQARRAMMEAFDDGCRYPYSQYRALEDRIARKEGLSPDHIVLGAGSHEILRVAGMAYGLGGGEILGGYPTFEGMENYAETVGAYVHRVPLNEDFQLDLEAMDRTCTQSVRLVFVCNPNNPTGTLVPGDRLHAFCRTISRRAVVLVDEAYHDYVESPEYASMVGLVQQGENVIISRTFSKIHGLAGLRVGYGLARPDVAARLRRFRSSAGVNIVGLRAAIASYQDDEFQAFCRRKNAEARTYLVQALVDMGYRTLPSHTNFVFFQFGGDAQVFRDAMQQRGILVGRAFPPHRDWCRVSLGTMDELKIFVSELRTFKNQL